MDVSQIALISLRVFHAVAALVWLGGGFYYYVAVRPAGRSEFATAAQIRFHVWARPATLVMIVSGVVLLFQGLSSNTAGITYVALLAAKIIAALVAFWLVRPRKRASGTSRSEMVITLGMSAFVLGVIISAIWPAG